MTVITHNCAFIDSKQSTKCCMWFRYYGKHSFIHIRLMSRDRTHSIKNSVKNPSLTFGFKPSFKPKLIWALVLNWTSGTFRLRYCLKLKFNLKFLHKIKSPNVCMCASYNTVQGQFTRFQMKTQWKICTQHSELKFTVQKNHHNPNNTDIR